jgi:hypothetical protein
LTNRQIVRTETDHFPHRNNVSPRTDELIANYYDEKELPELDCIFRQPDNNSKFVLGQPLDRDGPSLAGLYVRNESGTQKVLQAEARVALKEKEQKAREDA